MALLETIEAGALNVLEFLLTVIREIDAPEVLHALKRTLDDSREITSGVPAGAKPRRRLSDLAVNAFIRRLQLDVDFELSDSRRYTAAQVGQVRRKINASIPQR